MGSTKLFFILTLAVISGLIFAMQTLINVNIIKATFGTNHTNLEKSIQTTKTLTDNQNDNKSNDNIKTNEENKKENSNNRKNSGNRKLDAKPEENKEI